MLLLLTPLSGCRAPLPFLDPTFATRPSDSIVFLPLVDKREKPADDDDLDLETVRMALRRLLEQKGYRVTTPSGFVEDSSITADEVAHMCVSQLASLGPQESQVLLLVYIEHISAWETVPQASVSGLLIERASRAVLWRDQGIRPTPQERLQLAVAGIMVPPYHLWRVWPSTSLVVRRAMEAMFSSLPAHGAPAALW